MAIAPRKLNSVSWTLMGLAVGMTIGDMSARFMGWDGPVTIQMIAAFIAFGILFAEQILHWRRRPNRNDSLDAAHQP